MNRSYYGWLAGSTFSVLGDTVLFFALGWAATGIGPQVAALVLTGFTVPRAVLFLLGGVIGDRIGPRRQLLVCTAIIGSCCFLLAAVVGVRGVSAGLDSAAIVKLVHAEDESPALRGWLDERAETPWVSSVLAEIESFRALARHAPEAVVRLPRVLDLIDLRELDAGIRILAQAVRPAIVRSLDAFTWRPRCASTR